MSAPPPPYPGTDPSYPEKGGMPQPYQPSPQGGYPQQPYPQGQQAYPQGQAYPPAQGQPQGGYPQTGPPVYPQAGQPGYTQSSTVVVTQPVVTATVVQHFREVPVQTTCPHCHAQIVTAVNYETGTLTWLLCVILCVVGCDLGCCFIPFCVDSCKDTIHTCPSCHQMVGRWNRM